MKNTQNTRTKKNLKKGFIGIALLAMVLIGMAMYAGYQSVAKNTQVVSGHISKQLELFTLTTEEGVKYHVFDPNHQLDKLAKERNIQGKFYDMENVKIKGVTNSEDGYGHMGFYKYQIIVLNIEED